MKPQTIGILVLFILIQSTIVFAVPVIESFKLQAVFPSEIQITWKINDAQGLSKVQIYKDGKEIYKGFPIGNTETNLYQMGDDNETHVFDITVYNIKNESSTAMIKGGGDRNPPQITIKSVILSNTKELIFTTDEPTKCKIGTNSTNLIDVKENLTKEHKAAVSVNEGLTKLYITCADELDNKILKPVSVDFVLDTTSPGQVSDVSFLTQEKEIRLLWTSANDANGIDSYNIYNSLKQIATTKDTYWDVETNDSIYYITAVDKAENEGAKTEYNLRRELLLKSPMNKTEEVKEVKKEETPKEKTPISTLSIIIWSVFGTLIIVYIGWKIYEHRTDRHGLRRYLKQRRKMRDIDARHIKK